VREKTQEIVQVSQAVDPSREQQAARLQDAGRFGHRLPPPAIDSPRPAAHKRAAAASSKRADTSTGRSRQPLRGRNSE